TRSPINSSSRSTASQPSAERQMSFSPFAENWATSYVTESFSNTKYRPDEKASFPILKRLSNSFLFCVSTIGTFPHAVDDAAPCSKAALGSMLVYQRTIPRCLAIPAIEYL